MAEIKIADVRQIAPIFSTSTAYAVGDYVIYQGLLYRCIAAHAAGAWNASHFTQTDTGGELSDLKDDLNSLGLSVIDGKLNVTYTIQEGE